MFREVKNLLDCKKRGDRNESLLELEKRGGLILDRKRKETLGGFWL